MPSNLNGLSDQRKLCTFRATTNQCAKHCPPGWQKGELQLARAPGPGAAKERWVWAWGAHVEASGGGCVAEEEADVSRAQEARRRAGPGLECRVRRVYSVRPALRRHEQGAAGGRVAHEPPPPRWPGGACGASSGQPSGHRGCTAPGRRAQDVLSDQNWTHPHSWSVEYQPKSFPKVRLSRGAAWAGRAGGQGPRASGDRLQARRPDSVAVCSA